MFLLWLSLFILSGAISLLFCSSILVTYRPGEYLFLLFHTVHVVLKARILKWFAIPFSSFVFDHVLSEFSTMTHLSWVLLHGITHSFIVLDKAVIIVISLVSFL